jgi:hypothetical protein
MSFSSSQWTLPELCVWIVTRSRASVNSLPDPDVGSLKDVDRVHLGAYAARDDVVAAAQIGSITITCAGKPDRQALSAQFWKDAEIADSDAGWMADFAPMLVARRADRTGEEYYALRVGSGDALALWPAPRSSVEHSAGASMPIAAVGARAAGRRGAVVPIDDQAILAEMKNRAALDGEGFSVRAFVLDNEKRISGPNNDAKVRRLQRKYDEAET